MDQKVIAALLQTALGLTALGCGAAFSQRSAVPDLLQVGAGRVLALQARASGVQIYTCSASADASRYGWTLKAPQADLFDGSGRRIGRHYAGPTWEAADGSTVGGAVKARADAPSADAIPWLLLNATSNGGAGVFAHVTDIQRIDTSGGGAPHDAPCDDTRAGSERRMPYSATYLFYTAGS
jgi:hypothetical protein